MFAIGFFLMVAVLLAAAVWGKDAPEWVKLAGGASFLIAVLLMAASVAVGLWRVLP